jgi:hypothetical protein
MTSCWKVAIINQAGDFIFFCSDAYVPTQFKTQEPPNSSIVKIIPLAKASSSPYPFKGQGR